MISKLRKDDKGKGRGSEALKYLLYYKWLFLLAVLLLEIVLVRSNILVIFENTYPFNHLVLYRNKLRIQLDKY